MFSIKPVGIKRVSPFQGQKRGMAKASTKVPEPKSGVEWDSLTFALTPTETMYLSKAHKGDAFSKGEIVPYGPLPLYPSATVLNYGQGIFEGIKAFRTAKNRIVVFRPQQNHKRMNAGCERFCMSPVSEEVFLDAIARTVKSNGHYVPPNGKGALYLRPIIFGSGAQLGVAPSSEYIFSIFASPVGSYFKAGKITPIKLLTTTDYFRAARNGSGGTKAIGNYAPVFYIQQKAKKEGFNEVLFLDSSSETFVEEAGASNFFCLDKNGVLHTPELNSHTILPGVTRLSVMQLAQEMGVKVVEGKLSLDFVLKNGKEVFCTGTGASITPVGCITFKGKDYTFNNGEVGAFTQQIYKTITDIQNEHVEDKRGWLFDAFLD